MIAHLAISPETLDDLSKAGGRIAKRDHERFLDLVLEHGALVFPDDDTASSFLRYVRSEDSGLPPGVGKRWMEVIRKFHETARMKAERPALRPSLCMNSSFDDLAHSWADSVDVAVVDAETGAALGVPEEDGWLYESRSGFEVAASDVVADCHHIAQMRALQSEGVFPTGRRRDDFWNRVLAPMWTMSKRVTLVDRYLFKGAQGDGSWRTDHLEWILNRLADAPGPPGQVMLIGEALFDRNIDIDSTLDVVQAACSAGRVHLIQVVLVPARPRGRGSDMPHDRHIRFDTGAVILHAGFDRLSRHEIDDRDGMHWEYKWHPTAIDSLREAERRARRQRGTLIGERCPT